MHSQKKFKENRKDDELSFIGFIKFMIPVAILSFILCALCRLFGLA